MQLRQKRCWQWVTTGSSQVSMQMGHSLSRPRTRVCSRASLRPGVSPARDRGTGWSMPEDPRASSMTLVCWTLTGLQSLHMHDTAVKQVLSAPRHQPRAE